MLEAVGCRNQNIANLSVTVKKETNVNTFIPELQKKLNALSGKAVYTVSNSSIAGDDTQLKINLTGADNQTLESMALTIQKPVETCPWISCAGDGRN